MNIHFACLFGVKFELDLLPYWPRFYLDANLDSYKIFLHDEETPVSDDTILHFKSLGFDVTTLEGPHGNGMLRREAIGRYSMTLPDDDILVTADADEFQFLPPPSSMSTASCLHQYTVIPYRDLLDEYDCISGWMIDRWNNKGLQKCVIDPFEQYPEEEEFTGDFLKAITPPFLRLTKWPATRRTKVLACRCGDHLSYDGSHGFLMARSNMKTFENCRVIHFAWRESAKRKVAEKTYYSSKNVHEIFEGHAPSALMEKRMAICAESFGRPFPLTE